MPTKPASRPDHSPNSGLSQLIGWGVVVIFALLPFHAFLTTWAGSNFGHLDWWRIWKELLLAVLGLPALWLAWRNRRLRSWARHEPLVWLMAAFVTLHVLAGVVALSTDTVNKPALLYAWLANLRPVLFFLLVMYVVAAHHHLRRVIVRVVGVGGVLVASFGLLQAFVLPLDVLRHVGYGPDTIPAVQTVDNKSSYQRIQSTLRGANPLGAYLILILAGALSYLIKRGAWAGRRWFGLMFVLLAVLCLGLSFSRSAYLGLAVTVCVLVACSGRVPLRRLVAVGVAGTLLLLGGIVVLRDNDAVQNLVFHSDEHSVSERSSNADRWEALRSGLSDVAREPLGRGPGTAGPASTRNAQPARIAENYFLQIGQEVGWLGLLLCLGLYLRAGWLLWLKRADWLALGLLASLCGLTLVNMLSHAWADDTLGLLWWGLFGALVGSAIIPGVDKRKQH